MTQETISSHMGYVRLACALLLAGAAAAQVEVVTSEGIHLVAGVRDGHLAAYDGSQWRPQFWRGVNAGVTTPGHFPGELSASKGDWARWFPQIKAMNARVLRVYTILPPGFYEALVEFNRTQQEPLWVLQGIWPPEEDLIGEDGLGRNAYTPEITAQFEAEIADAVRAAHGDLVRDLRPGRAGGIYTADISPYMLGWLVGAEWYQFAVRATNQAAAGTEPYSGTYFRAKAAASPFESWLTRMLDRVAAEDMRYGWQHPMAFVNWVTTDPLSHPSEPNPGVEDLVSLDPMHLEPTAAWQAGYFASYHVYPHYPDFIRWEPAYQKYVDAAGNVNPYAAYLNQLRAWHKGIPLLVTEFGVPSSRGMAHYAARGWNQGMHTEREQGEIDAELLGSIYSEGYDGAILFGWQDEWYKFTWNTVDLEVPFDRRPLWLNRLTNERFFGMLAMDPASAGSNVILDGQPDEWASLQGRGDWRYAALDLSAIRDEAYLKLLVRKREGEWDFARDRLYLGFATLPGGSTISDKAPGIAFSHPFQFLFRLENGEARWFVLSAYDQHTYRWGIAQPTLTVPPEYADPGLGLFLPWKLLVNRAVRIPTTGETIPPEEVEIGQLRRGADDLADWEAQGNTIEIRIPWALIGFMDPSSHKVWDWPCQARGIVPVSTDGVRIEPRLATEGREVANDGPEAIYRWEGWELPAYRERLKAGYGIMQEAMTRCDVPQPPRETTVRPAPGKSGDFYVPDDQSESVWRVIPPK